MNTNYTDEAQAIRKSRSFDWDARCSGASSLRMTTLSYFD
jgi:hypothetical protein